MMKLIIFTFLFVSFLGYANDGVYYGSGNQLIPIYETDIAIHKEILTIKKVGDKHIDVTVYYEFFNPKGDKELLVGFEAFAPAGDVDPSPRLGQHPYMFDFTVNLNNEILQYKVAYIVDSITTDKTGIKSLDLKALMNPALLDYSFYYVYNFKAKFKKGLNTIVHTYRYELSSSVEDHFDFGYILTAANRWANKQIDDFTLILDLGECEEFNVGKTFFTENSKWVLNGLGRIDSGSTGEYYYREYDPMHVVMQKGTLIFQEKNFHPKGELFVWCKNYMGYEESFMKNEFGLPYSYYQQRNIQEPTTDFEKKILRNLAFARRGYIFKTEELQKYFSKMSWYIPNPNFDSGREVLHDLELEMLDKYKGI